MPFDYDGNSSSWILEHVFANLLLTAITISIIGIVLVAWFYFCGFIVDSLPKLIVHRRYEPPSQAAIGMTGSLTILFPIGFFIGLFRGDSINIVDGLKTGLGF